MALTLAVSACGSAAPAGREAVPTVATAPPTTANIVELPQPPETYGLVSLAQLQADPGAVAKSLTDQLGAHAWTANWRLWLAGEEAGTMTLEHLPAEDGRSDRLHVQGNFSAGDTRSMEVHVLDDGNGARACVREKQQPFLCDKNDFALVLQFLSVEGLQQLAAVVQDAMTKPGAAVQYKMVAGEPATCFIVAPKAMGLKTLGVDFESGGLVCLSRLGAILKLETGTMDIEAVEYRTTADEANFRMPV